MLTFQIVVESPFRDKLIAIQEMMMGKEDMELLAASIETYSHKRKCLCNQHMHVLVRVTCDRKTVGNRLDKIVENRQINDRTSRPLEEQLRYVCKGRKRGQHDVTHMSGSFDAEYWNNSYWDMIDRIAQQKGKKGNPPLFLSIAEYVAEHLVDFSTVRETEVGIDGQIVEVPEYRVLDNRKIVQYVVSRYSEAGPLYNSDVVEKCWYFIVGRIEKEDIVNKIMSKLKLPSVRVTV